MSIVTLQLPVELFGALKGRLYDSNKNLIMATLATLGGLASAMGPPVEKCSKVAVNSQLFVLQSRYIYALLM